MVSRLLLLFVLAVVLNAQVHITNSVAFGASSLKIVFSDDMSDVEIITRKISNTSLYVDINAVLDNGKKVYYFPSHAQITIAQNTPKTTRIVIDNGNYMSHQIKIIQKNIYISFMDKIPESKQPTTKPTTTNPSAMQPPSPKQITKPAQSNTPNQSKSNPQTQPKSTAQSQPKNQTNTQPKSTPKPTQPTTTATSTTSTKAQNPPKNPPKPAPTQVISTSSHTKNKYKIVIDAGHGGKDCGAIGETKVCEKHIVLKVAQALNKELKKRGYITYMTRDKDVYINLKERTDFANSKNADLFISIHANSVPKTSSKSPKGVETYFLSAARSDRARDVAEQENKDDIDVMNFFSKQTFLNSLNSHRLLASNKLAIDIQYGILNELKKNYQGIVDGGVREGPFWVLAGALMPSVLVEIGYNSNPIESVRLNDEKYQRFLAIGIANGVDGFIAKNY